MRYWDSSALVPLVCYEAETARCEQWLAADHEIITWAFTPTEVLSALYRKLRAREFKESDCLHAREQLVRLQSAWIEVVNVEIVRQRAHRLLAVHSLRAADALQLAAALTVFDRHIEQEHFMTFDQLLAAAARKEGFTVLGA
ncbi:MAG: type II toxin-antitoxin system VapC family toxin [Deltaproteobacteria bacterium]|nr:type II toxin-antitoxin system VapC family toxin [Deltaproteobacteria bacterium]